MEKDNKNKMSKEEAKELFSRLLNFLHEDMEDYEKWIVGGSACLSKERLKEMRILGTLDKLGYPLNHFGTHLLKEYVVGITDIIDPSKYEESKIILGEVSSEGSVIRKDLTCCYLGISDDIFQKNINGAIKGIDHNRADKEFAKKVYGPNGMSYNIGTNAYQVALDYMLWEEEKTRKEVGTFVATTFSDKDIIFKVYDNGFIECPTLDIKKIRKIDLKPRFELHSEVMDYTYDAPKNYKGDTSGLIKEFDINEDLMLYMQSKGMVRYSQDMAVFYGFDALKAYDRNGGYPFKRAIKKGPILKYEKEGIFN